jgi:hypothetical protein
VSVAGDGSLLDNLVNIDPVIRITCKWWNLIRAVLYCMADLEQGDH